MKSGIPPPSIVIIGTLMLITLSSAAVFFILVRRWTWRRRDVWLAEWAARHRMKRSRAPGRALPPPIEPLHPIVRIEIANKTTTAMRFEAGDEHRAFNVLIRRCSNQRIIAPAALRPSSLPEKVCAIDLFSLAPFHGLSNDRFIVMGIEAKAATQLANSSARALLPPDVGLFIDRGLIMLDFSARPFDPVELDRMISVSEQLSVVC